IPWLRGKLLDAQKLVLRDASGKAVRLQSRALDRWPDGSVRWVLLDWIAEANAGPYRAEVGDSGAVGGPAVKGKGRDGGGMVDRCAALFEIGKDRFPFRSVSINGVAVIDVEQSGFRVADGWPTIDSITVEESGPLRTVVSFRGRLVWENPK